MKTCKTCRHWSIFPEEDATTGECVLAQDGREHALHWLGMWVSSDGGRRFVGPVGHRQEVAPGTVLRAAMETDRDFGCVSHEEAS